MLKNSGKYLKILKIAFAIATPILLNAAPTFAFPSFEFEHPYTPEEFVEQQIKGVIDPEIRTYVGAMAGILVLHLLIKR